METSPKLVRPQDGRVVAGVCAALARRFGLDVTLVRIAWVVALLCVGTGFLLYLILWLVIPSE